MARPHVAVLGAGFGGLSFCRHFRADARITLVDAANHHLFQPLLYQVATAGLSAPEIAEPVRSIFRNDPRITVLMESVRGIDLSRRTVALGRGELRYDHLVLALGGVTHYFGHDEWARHAPGLKSLGDAMTMRSRLLRAFERAESSDDEALRERLMTVVVIGGGPTGVELAGAIAELTRVVFQRDFRNIDPTRARIVLVEGGERLLDSFSPKLAESARRQLEGLGVEVRLGERAVDVGADGVALSSGQRIESRTLLWGAGVVAHPLARSLGVELGSAGRIRVEPDLRIPGHPEAFAIGDIAELVDANGVEVPGLAPAALQMGRHVAGILDRRITDGDAAFAYRDRGAMATIGRKRAVAELFGWELSGVVAWLGWLWVHLVFLIGFRNKVAVLLAWFYSYVTFRRGARIVWDGDHGDSA